MPTGKLYKKNVQLKPSQKLAYKGGRYFAVPKKRAATSASLMKLRTAPQLRAVAQGEVGTEISTEVAPQLEAERSLARRRGRVMGDISRLYGGLTPAVGESAQRVAGYAGQQAGAEREIFQRYAQQLAGLQQGQASQAQQMAQTVGGPVPVSEFTAGTEAAAGAAPALAAGQMLQTAGLASGDVRQVESFAGQVFPLMQREDTASQIANFEEKADEIRREITRIRSTRGGRESKRFNELLAGEREYQLGVLGSNLERLKANRDWKLAQASLKQAGVELGLKADAQDLAERAQTEQTQLGWAQLTQQERESRRSAALAKAQLRGQVKKTSDAARAGELIEAALNGTDAEVTETREVQVGAFKPGSPLIPEGAYIATGPDGKPIVDKNGNYEYVRAVNVKSVIPAPPRVDPSNTGGPSELYRFLLYHGIPAAMAAQRVRQALNLKPSWKPTPLGGPPPKSGPAAPGKKQAGPFGKKKGKKKAKK